jgi:hypothetical protein
MRILPEILDSLFNVDDTFKHCPLCNEILTKSTCITSECGPCRRESRPFSLGTSSEPCYCEDYREECLECKYCSRNGRDIYLFVPFKQKDIAKELGCEWDSYKQRWWFKYSYWNKEKAIKLLKMFGSPRVQMLLEKMY